MKLKNPKLPLNSQKEVEAVQQRREKQRERDGVNT